MINDGINLLDNVPCSIFCFTNDGIITYANNHLLQQLNFTLEELSGQHVEKIFTVSTRIFFQTHFFPLLNLQGNVNEVFCTLLSKEKLPVPVLVNASQTKHATGTVNVCACLNVQQRTKYEDEILAAKKTAEDALHKNELLLKAQHQLEMSKQELDKQITQLKYTHNELLQLNDIVSHDLQEPVRKIGLYVDLLKNSLQAQAAPKVQSSFDVITSSANRIRTVLQNLQEYIQILTKEIRKQPVDLTALIEAEITAIKEQDEQVTFGTSLVTLPVISADVSQVKVLFAELLKNSLSFKSVDRDLMIKISGSVVEENLYSSTEGKYKYVEFVRIIIEDNGVGFNPKYKDLIFRILKRLDYNTTGLGFGLAICKRIAENHRGFIQASGEENKGAKFTVYLPVAH